MDESLVQQEKDIKEQIILYQTETEKKKTE